MKNFLAIIFILFTIPAFGQYQYFTNIKQNQVYENVSLSGSNCGPRLQSSFKTFRLSNLGNEGFKYGYISYDQPINFKNGNYIGIGGRMMIIDSGIFDKRSSSLLTSFNKRISDKNGTKQFLSLGVGFTLAQERVSNEDLRWPSQIDSSGFNPNLPGEGDIIGDFFYPEIEIGVSYSLLKNQNEYLKVGLSIKDLNQPEISFLGSNPITIPSTLIISAMGSYVVMEDLYWQPQARFNKTQGDKIVSLVSNFKFVLSNKSTSLIFGAAYTNNKIFSLNLGGDLGRLSGIISYDFNLNSAIAVVINPSIEFGLGYRFCN